MDDFWEIVYSWGHRYWLEGIFTVVVFVVVHFVGYPFIARRHLKLAEQKAPSSEIFNVDPKKAQPDPVSKAEPVPQNRKRPATQYRPYTAGVPKHTTSPVQAQAPRGIVQSAPNGINIGGDNTGTATVNNFGPRPMAISDYQLAAVTSRVRQFKGEKNCLAWEMGNEETDVFVSRLSKALQNAGLTVVPIQAAMLLTLSGRRPQPGLQFEFPDGKPELMTEIANGLAGSGFPIPPRGFSAVPIRNPSAEAITCINIGQSQ